MRISTAVKEKMKEQGLNQLELATQLGLQRPFINMFVNEKKGIHSDVTQKIIDHLGIKTKYGNMPLFEVIKKEIEERGQAKTKVAKLANCNYQRMIVYLKGNGNIGSNYVDNLLEYLDIELI